MRRRMFSLHSFALALIVALTLTSLAAAQSITVGYRAGTDALYQALEAAFEKENPGFDVVLVPVTDNWREKLGIMYATNTAPDLFASPGDEVADFIDSGQLQDLSAYFARDGISSEDFFPIEVDYAEGRPIAVGVYWGPVISVYNKSLFEAQGLASPGDWTWDDLLEAAKRLTRDDNGDGTPETWGTSVQIGTWTWHAKLAGWGATLFDRVLYPTESRINSPEAIEALQWFADLINVHRVAPSPAIPFQSGNLGIDEFGPWQISAFQASIGDSFVWDAAAFPAGPAGRAARYAQEIMYLSKNSPNKDAAWAFMRFVMSDAGQRIVADVQGAMPVRKETALTYWAQNQDVNRQVFIEGGSYLIRRPYSPAINSIDQILGREFGPVWSGDRPASEAAHAADAQIDAILAELAN